MAESATEAAMRVARPLMDEIRAEGLRAADRRVIDRIVSEDEEGRPRVVEPQIEDAALREAMGLF